MVTEREPPREPSSEPPKEPATKPKSDQAYLDYIQRSGNAIPPNAPAPNVFVVPKTRPEHHRTFDRGPTQPPSAYRQPPTLSSTIKSDNPVGISRPTNTFTWGVMEMSNSSRTSLHSKVSTTLPAPTTLGRYENFLLSGQEGGEFGYVDQAKAQENIKALLEGAFEDEDDVPRTRRRRKEVKAAVDGDKARDFQEKAEQAVEPEEDGDDGYDGTVEGLSVKLLPHQVDGLAWMKEKETGSQRKKSAVLPKGGILADDMGLGKTIQAIALLLSNPRPPLSSDPTEKSDKKQLSNTVGRNTLVVAPLALIRQWEGEIANRVRSSHKLRVCVHHGPRRTKRYEDLRKYDVIITTYQVLVSEYGSSGNMGEGPQVGCFGIHWYRVILDEAHTIKNRNAKSTLACYALRSEYRWCLTGTPMQNNLDELQSLIRFLRIKPYNELPVWREQITTPLSNGRGGVAMKRLQAVLKVFMKRRTKDILKGEGALNPGGKASDGTSTGFKIMEREVQDVVVDFSKEERSFYDKLASRAGSSIDQMLGNDQISYASALVLLLRLRQACNHPELVRGYLGGDTDALTTEKASSSQSSRASSSVEKELDEVADLLGGLSVQTKQCDVCQSQLTKDESSKGKVRCGACEEDLASLKSKSKAGRSKTQKPKVKEPQVKRRAKKLTVYDSDEEDEADELAGPSKQHDTKPRRVGSHDHTDSGGEPLGSEGDANEDSNDENSQSEASSDDLGAKDIPDRAASSKILRLMEILREESGQHKFIVFSQFTSMLDLIEPFLEEEDLDYVRYDGKMRNDAREESLDRLRNRENTRILLCSLKCGSLGLNLTAASRVVILEPFWNPFVEEQAIDRVHRLNQTVDVVVYKLTIANSVEERIIELQGKKRALAAAAIEGKAVAKLSMKDLLSLFGRDAEHDPRHQDLGPLGKQPRILPSAEGYAGPGAQADQRRKFTPLMKGTGKEDPVYGRR